MEFLSNYGLWILLAAIFVGMHVFGMGCCGGHQHGQRKKDAGGDSVAEPTAGSSARAKSGGCH
ncbi:MAG: hypothetical protein ACE147_17935 [Candidatus Methylomirabilales bacterium]